MEAYIESFRSSGSQEEEPLKKNDEEDGQSIHDESICRHDADVVIWLSIFELFWEVRLQHSAACIWSLMVMWGGWLSAEKVFSPGKKMHFEMLDRNNKQDP